MIRTEFPDETFSNVKFNSWDQRHYDQNDNLSDSDWYKRRVNNEFGAIEKGVAEKAFVHDKTFTKNYLDSLGRTFLSIANNSEQRSGEAILTGACHTRTNIDIEGNARSVTDDRGNAVMEWKYDMLGNICYQKSMDSGERWMLMNVMGKPIRLWDSREQVFKYEYDELMRPIHFIAVTGGEEKV